MTVLEELLAEDIRLRYSTEIPPNNSGHLPQQYITVLHAISFLHTCNKRTRGVAVVLCRQFCPFHGRSQIPETVFLNFYGSQESVSRN